MPQVKDLTISEFKELIEQTVEQKLLELLGDPDEGLELRKEVKARLKRSSARERKGIRGIPIAEVKLPAQRAGLLKVNGNGSRVTKAEPESTS